MSLMSQKLLFSEAIFAKDLKSPLDACLFSQVRIWVLYMSVSVVEKFFKYSWGSLLLSLSQKKFIVLVWYIGKFQEREREIY